VSREDFVDFAAEVKSWLQQEVESLRTQMRTATVTSPSADGGDGVRRERFVDAP